ncbi:hypothetical protein OAT16_09415 [Prolixibacteraceae bacterium]|nr:hypothetical protein [Prolixibacteraceae bacterium]
MMKSITSKFWVFLFLMPIVGLAQEGNYFGAAYTYNSYKLEGLIPVQQSFNTMDLDLVEIFPRTSSFSLQYGYQWDNFTTGVNFDWYRTGARSNRRDYSGSSTCDMYVNGVASSMFLAYRTNPLWIIRFSSGTKFGMVFSNIDFNVKNELYQKGVYGDDLIVKNSRLDNVITETSLFLEPYASLSFFFVRSACIYTDVGYNLNFCSLVYSIKDQNNSVKLTSNRRNRINWNGLRLSVGIKWYLGGKSKSDIKENPFT